MTVLATGWENMGGRVLRKISAGADQGDTINHPLNGPLPGDADQVDGSYNRSRWTNTGAGDYPGNLGAELLDVATDTLAEAFAATPV